MGGGRRGGRAPSAAVVAVMEEAAAASRLARSAACSFSRSRHVTPEEGRGEDAVCGITARGRGEGATPSRWAPEDHHHLVG